MLPHTSFFVVFLLDRSFFNNLHEGGDNVLMGDETQAPQIAEIDLSINIRVIYLKEVVLPQIGPKSLKRKRLLRYMKMI